MEKLKLKNGEFRYRECYYIGNKKITSPSFKKITDAKIWKSRVETERLSKLALGEHYHKNIEVNFEEFANKWLHNHIEVNCARKTFLYYGSILRIHLYPRFAKLNFSEITEDHGVALMSDLMDWPRFCRLQIMWYTPQPRSYRWEQKVDLVTLKNLKLMH